MQTIIAWTSGSGNITLTYTGQGNSTIIVESDDNNLDVERSQDIVIKTVDGSVRRTVTIVQAKAPNFKTADGKFIRLSNGLYFNVKE